MILTPEDHDAAVVQPRDARDLPHLARRVQVPALPAPHYNMLCHATSCYVRLYDMLRDCHDISYHVLYYYML